MQALELLVSTEEVDAKLFECKQERMQSLRVVAGNRIALEHIKQRVTRNDHSGVIIDKWKAMGGDCSLVGRHTPSLYSRVETISIIKTDGREKYVGPDAVVMALRVVRPYIIHLIIHTVRSRTPVVHFIIHPNKWRCVWDPAVHQNVLRLSFIFNQYIPAYR